MGSIEQEQRPQAIPNEADFKWTESVSKNGNTYEAGSKLNDDGSSEIRIPKEENRSSHGAPFSVDVNWPVDGRFKLADADLKARTGIESYEVGKSSSWIYDYYIEFFTRQDYDYHFKDETNDSYEVNVFEIDKTHIVRFNSKHPTIKTISGK